MALVSITDYIRANHATVSVNPAKHTATVTLPNGTTTTYQLTLIGGQSFINV